MNPLWIWWMFQLTLIFLADISRYILVGCVLALVAKIVLRKFQR
jgi:hypothetical protein